MFRAKRNYPYADFDSVLQAREYKIGDNDVLQIRTSPNKGAAILEQSTSAGGMQGGGVGSGASIVVTTVDYDGTVKLPLLGRVYVRDLEIREAELLFEERLKQFFVDPFVRIEITNKRVILFPGAGGAARVVYLPFRNTNLLEALAMVGGLSSNARANRIKLIRGDLKNPQVFRIDLSRIEKMREADLILQGNDIIYIEPRNEILLNFMARVSPYLAVFNFGLLVYGLVPK